MNSLLVKVLAACSLLCSASSIMYASLYESLAFNWRFPSFCHLHHSQKFAFSVWPKRRTSRLFLCRLTETRRLSTSTTVRCLGEPFLSASVIWRRRCAKAEDKVVWLRTLLIRFSRICSCLRSTKCKVFLLWSFSTVKESSLPQKAAWRHVTHQIQNTSQNSSFQYHYISFVATPRWFNLTVNLAPKKKKKKKQTKNSPSIGSCRRCKIQRESSSHGRHVPSGPCWATESCRATNRRGLLLKQVRDSAEAIGLYFSASWCAPCRAFTPQLKSVYEKLGGKFEIVLVPGDRDAASWQSYWKEMPWLSFEFGTKIDA